MIKYMFDRFKRFYRVNKEQINGILSFFSHIAFMIIMFIMIIYVLVGCSTVREIPINTVEKIVYKDSLIYVNDTITVEIERETVKEVIPDIDTSYLETSLANSIAYIDTLNRKLCHTLEQKGNVEVIVDTVFSIQYVDRIIEKDVPVQVEVVKYKRDGLFYFLILYTIFSILFILIKIWLKFEKII